MMPTPAECYQKNLASGEILPDAAQALAVEQLQRVYDEMVARWQQPSWRRYFQRTPPPVKGLYLWGGVGVGKTYLMDIFYQCLPSERKCRQHFHHFMRSVHEQLKALKSAKDPLEIIAKQIKATTDVICFDEFFVKDIANAMILGNLFQALFKRGITLVATSNVVPDKLYRNGLQRDRFLPAIDLLNQHTEVLHLNSENDYRLRELTKAGVYFTPLGEVADAKMQAMFCSLLHDVQVTRDPITIDQRDIAVIARASDVIWFDFNVLCQVPRSQGDYLEIANEYHTVLLSQVPKIAEGEDSLVTYLIFLVDICYDAKVKLILSAAVDIMEIYPRGRLAFEFQRTQSRLIEMQTKEYLSLPHQPSA